MTDIQIRQTPVPPDRFHRSAIVNTTFIASHAEHPTHICNKAGVKSAQIQLSQGSTATKHTTHICDTARVKSCQINIRQAAAARKHMFCRSYARHFYNHGRHVLSVCPWRRNIAVPIVPGSLNREGSFLNLPNNVIHFTRINRFSDRLPLFCHYFHVPIIR